MFFLLFVFIISLYLLKNIQEKVFSQFLPEPKSLRTKDSN